MSKYRSFPLISWKKRALKGKPRAKQPENKTKAVTRSAITPSIHGFSLGYPSVLINHDFHLLR
jgi:hypothetical protein